MMDDLQTLCAAALRRHYVSAAYIATSVSDREDIYAIDALSECLKLSDKPFLQMEASWALACVFNRLPAEQIEEVIADDAHPLKVLCKLRQSSNGTVRAKAGVALGAIVNRKSEENHSWVWGGGLSPGRQDVRAGQTRRVHAILRSVSVP